MGLAALIHVRFSREFGPINFFLPLLIVSIDISLYIIFIVYSVHFFLFFAKDFHNNYKSQNLWYE